MFVKQKRVNNINNVIGSIPSGKNKIRVCYSLQNKEVDLDRVGFSPNLIKEGDSILPKRIAPVSKFNADGKLISRKDLPKESRFLFQRVWEWKLLDGTPMERVVDYYRDCYPRDLTPAPCKEFIYCDDCLTSEILEIEDEEGLKHTINLFLEFFGECEIVYEDFTKIITYSKRQVNWQFLPAGENLWAAVLEYLRSHNIGNDNAGSLIIERQEILKNYNPIDIVQGLGGFNEYLAYIFPNFTLLESVRYGNAIYVLEKNWEEISKLTKSEIISQNLQKERIIHCTGWKEKIQEFIN